MTEGVRVVPIREESIRLGQFLKLADLVDQGSDVRPLLGEGLVSVNGVVETRRGRQLVKGDVITLAGPHTTTDTAATAATVATVAVG